MKEMLDQEDIRQAIEEYVRRKAYALIQGLEMDDVEFSYSKKEGVSAIVYMKPRTEIAKYNEDLVADLDFESMEIIKEMEKGGRIELDAPKKLPQGFEEFM